MSIRASVDDGATRKVRSIPAASVTSIHASASSGVRSGVMTPLPPAAATVFFQRKGGRLRSVDDRTNKGSCLSCVIVNFYRYPSFCDGRTCSRLNSRHWLNPILGFKGFVRSHQSRDWSNIVSRKKFLVGVHETVAQRRMRVLIVNDRNPKYPESLPNFGPNNQQKGLRSTLQYHSTNLMHHCIL